MQLRDMSNLMAQFDIFDMAMARRRLHKALTGSYADFLLIRAVDDLLERLGAVLRNFDVALDLGTPAAFAAQRLRAEPRIGHVVRAAQVADAGGDLLCDMEALPLALQSLELVVSLLALQGVNDLPGTLMQIRHALKPDGLFVGCMLGGDTLTELKQSFAEAEAEIEGGISPRVAPFADIRSAGALLQRAGFALPVTDVDTVIVRYATPFALMADLRAMGLTNTLVERRRTPTRRATLMRAMAIYAERFSDVDGRVRATFEIIWLSGWAPHESQQKPLKPGSAKMRLADALAPSSLAPSSKGSTEPDGSSTIS
jgi:SAM-dependent methyltransferase